MAKTKISEYDSTSANNTDVDSINIAEGCAPSGINNAIREVMAHLKDFQTGASGDSLTVGGNLSVTGTVTIPDNAISGDKVEGGTINAITINTLSANPTLSAGTANGVTYLNGSKVLTSGSALTFDGGSLASTAAWASGKGQIYTDASSGNLSGIANRYNGSEKGYLYYDNSNSTYNLYGGAGVSLAFSVNIAEQMRLTSTGLGIGTSSPTEKLTVNGAGLFTGALLNYRTNAGAIDYFNGVTRIWGFGPDASTAGVIELQTSANDGSPVNKMRFDASGNLGLGVTPSGWVDSGKLQFPYGGAVGPEANGYMNVVENAYESAVYTWRYVSSGVGAARYVVDYGSYRWFTAPSGTAGAAISFTQAMTLDAGGKLLLGVTTGAGLSNGDFAMGNGNHIRFRNAANSAYISALEFTSANGLNIGTGGSLSTITFGISGIGEVGRFDTSGNLLVGKTTTAIENVGTSILSTGRIISTANADDVLVLRRNTSDGDIVSFRKDGTTVGSIGSASVGKLYIGSPDGSGGFLRFESNQISPCSSSGGVRDNIIDLGKPESRFDDIFATNGTIQTSDANEKQDIEVLSEAEARVAVACKGLLRKFRWKDAVAEKGDEARIHFGIIAQDLQAAFAAQGLDAGRYAMFISSTWTDEETGEERTRLGVRYPELLAFIIAAI